MELHDYQREAVKHLHDHPRAGLFLDMGLGKTAITLSALKKEHLPVLVVAPKRVAESVWPVEQKKWRPDLKLVVAKGTPGERMKALASKADIVVVGKDNINDAVKSQKFKTLVVDELSAFKGRGVRWRRAKTLSRKADYVWGLTGTPAPNGLLDLWPQMYIIDLGERLHSKVTTFRERYFVPGKILPTKNIVIRWDLKPGADKKIYEKIEDICLYMSSDGKLNLPPVTYNTVEVPLSRKTMSVYNEFKETLVAGVRELLGGAIHSAPNAAVLSSKLSQVSAGFLLPDKDDPTGEITELHEEKIKAVQEIIEGTGSPVLVFYRYVHEKERLLKIEGARSIDEDGVIEEWNEGNVPVMVAHPASAGHGLNLQHGGHTIVWSSLTWELEHWQQGNARLARQGQTKPVVIHSLVSPGTVDGAMQLRLEGKKSVQQALLDHLEA